MTRNTLTMVLLTGAQVCRPVFGQAPPTILVVDLENMTRYVFDVADPLKFATNPGVTTPTTPTNFWTQMLISDIVAVNGQPAKGAQIFRETVLRLSPNPTPGQAIADITGNSSVLKWVILKPDGTLIGTLVGEGGLGAPVAIIGGTGAFLGARGQSSSGVASPPVRGASITEDPSNRRKIGGGRSQSMIYLIPLERPEIVITSGGPVVFHADFSPVTAAKPAKAGEVVIVRATGLGPTVPGVDPGQPFPMETAQLVNSPVAVTVNGKPAEVINAIGWPGQVNTYRVDLRIPDAIASGTAAIQLTAAWISGSAVAIPIQ